MAPLPPPPPPAPPPPPMGGPIAGPPKISKNEAMDRNAMLSQIRGGARLKKTTVVNDRSAPIIDGKAPKANTGVASKPTSNGPGGSPMQLGGLFAGGVPKLRSTGSKLVSNGPTVCANRVNNSYTKTDESVRPTNTSSIKTSLEGKLQMQTNNSSFLHSKTSSSNNSNNGLNANNNNKFHTMKAREKPSFMSSEGKGQAPQVPTLSANKVNAPELPKKPPGVQRSNSQSSGRLGANSGGRRLGPPNIKPPPPPKMTNGLSAPQPTQQSQSHPSKPSSYVNRRQSFTDEKSKQSENWSGRPDISALVSNFNQQGLKPPAPPRNGNSKEPNGISQSPTYPPPPPPISTIPTRSNSNAVRLPQMKSIAPNIPIQPSRAPSTVRPPLGPPPPPPHRSTSNNNSSNNNNNSYPSSPPPPPSQTKVIPTALRNGVLSGPPPPIRNTSISRDEFATRFATFKAIFELPVPTPMTAANKVYPSHMQQSQRRRDPPPPPPQSNGIAAHNSPNLNAHNSNAKKFSSSNPVLHIQIGSTVAQS